MSLFEYDASLRPMGVSYAVAASLLDGCQGRGWFDVPDPTLIVCLLADPRRHVAVLWRGNGGSASVQVPLDPTLVETRDMMGNCVTPTSHASRLVIEIGPEPVYLIVSQQQAEKLTEALKQATLVRTAS